MAASLAFALALSGCRDREQERLNLANLAGSKNPDEHRRAKAGFQKMLADDPHDTKVMLWLAVMHVQDRELDDAEALYRRVIADSKDPGEIGQAKDALAKLDVLAAAASAAPATSAVVIPPPAVPIVLGKSAGGVTVGDTLAAVEKALGPCADHAEAPPARVCHYAARGLDVGLKDDKVVRIGLYHAGRIVPAADFLDRRYAGYVGESAEGVRIGLGRDELVQKLGEPTQRFRPFGMASHGDGSLPFEVWDYPKKGVSFEMDLTGGGPIVGAIHVPHYGLVGKAIEAGKR